MAHSVACYLLVSLCEAVITAVHCKISVDTIFEVHATDLDNKDEYDRGLQADIIDLYVRIIRVLALFISS